MQLSYLIVFQSDSARRQTQLESRFCSDPLSGVAAVKDNKFRWNSLYSSLLTHTDPPCAWRRTNLRIHTCWTHHAGICARILNVQQWVTLTGPSVWQLLITADLRRSCNNTNHRHWSTFPKNMAVVPLIILRVTRPPFVGLSLNAAFWCSTPTWEDHLGFGYWCCIRLQGASVVSKQSDQLLLAKMVCNPWFHCTTHCWRYL